MAKAKAKDRNEWRRRRERCATCYWFRPSEKRPGLGHCHGGQPQPYRAFSESEFPYVIWPLVLANEHFCRHWLSAES